MELIVIFLGGIPSRGILFKILGAFHHAECMAMQFTAIKMFVFRGEYKLSIKIILCSEMFVYSCKFVSESMA